MLIIELFNMSKTRNDNKRMVFHLYWWIWDQDADADGCGFFFSEPCKSIDR